jgi:hypothetical protein
MLKELASHIIQKINTKATLTRKPSAGGVKIQTLSLFWFIGKRPLITNRMVTNICGISDITK